MAHEPDIDDDEEDYQEERRERRSPPRFGPFVTIAVAILMLFGAASRFGKTGDNGLWPNFDHLAANYIGGGSQSQAQMQPAAGTTILTLGTEPPRQPSRGMALNMRATPPPRGDFDLDRYKPQSQTGGAGLRPPQLSLPIPGQSEMENNVPGAPGMSHFDPAPEARPLAPEQRNASHYTVTAGDNWVKIGKATGKRWQDIQKANPESQAGLRVGMKLVLP